MPHVGVELVVPKPAVKLVTKNATLSNVVPVKNVTCPADIVELDATDCNVRSEPVAAPEYHVFDVAEGGNMSGAKMVTEYSADHPAESLGIAGSSLLCSGSDLTAPPLIILHL